MSPYFLPLQPHAPYCILICPVSRLVHVSLPLPASQINLQGQAIWENLEKSVEEGVKLCLEREKEKAATAAATPPVVEKKGEGEKKDVSESSEDSWDRVGDDGEEGKGVY